VSEYALRLSDEERARYRFMAEAAHRSETALWSTAGIGEGARVADVGCGPAAMSVVVAGVVGPTGHVWAVDGTADTAVAARETVDAAGVANVTVSTGDATDTGLEPGSVDVVMIRHVLAHNGPSEQAIVDHAATLARPGGTVFLVDIDASALRMRPEDPDVGDLDARYRQWHAQRGNDLAVGLRLDELLSNAALEVVAYEGRFQVVRLPPGVRPPAWAARDAMVTAGLADEDDVARWDAALDRYERRTPPPKLFVPIFLAVGRRPA
jgi:SAM-dependent methyltransferase